MPCNSDYMEPTGLEQHLQDTAVLYAYALDALDEEVSDTVHQAATDHYCSVDFVPDLCRLIGNMTEDERDRIVYNPRCKISRRLADWWEEHEAADQQRHSQEQKELLEQARYEEVIIKLSDEEIDILKKQWKVS
jgi:hypothetical protein